MPIIIIGQTGCGKTTLAEQLGERLQIPVISSGQIARDIARSDTFSAAGLERGDYAPELAIRQEVEAQAEAAMATAGDFVIEGFPRKLEQLIIMEQLLLHQQGVTYVHLVLDPLVCLRRLLQRNRPGDHPDAIAVRFRSFLTDTVPVLDALRPGGHLVTVDGQLTRSVITDQVAVRYAEVVAR